MQQRKVTKPAILNVTDDEWAAAAAYFKKNPGKNMLDKSEEVIVVDGDSDDENSDDTKASSNKNKVPHIVNFTDSQGKDKNVTLQHSFLNIKGELYAVTNCKMAGEKQAGLKGHGTSGMVKVAQNRHGYSVAVKIEGDKDSKLTLAEQVTMGRLGLLIGVLHRKRDHESNLFRNFSDGTERIVQDKMYSIMKLEEGKEAEKFYESAIKGKDDLSTAVEQLNFMLASAESIQQVHAVGAIHCDIKGANFLVNKDGDHITVSRVDFGLAKVLDSNITPIHDSENPKIGIITGEHIKDQQGNVTGVHFSHDACFGTEDYMAQECYDGYYSKASDIYALGKTYEIDVKINLSAFGLDKMLSEDPNERPDINSVIETIKSYKKLYDNLYEKLNDAKQEPYVGKTHDSSVNKKINELLDMQVVCNDIISKKTPMSETSRFNKTEESIAIINNQAQGIIDKIDKMQKNPSIFSKIYGVLNPKKSKSNDDELQQVKGNMQEIIDKNNGHLSQIKAAKQAIKDASQQKQSVQQASLGEASKSIVPAYAAAKQAHENTSNKLRETLSTNSSRQQVDSRHKSNAPK